MPLATAPLVLLPPTALCHHCCFPLSSTIASPLTGGITLNSFEMVKLCFVALETLEIAAEKKLGGFWKGPGTYSLHIHYFLWRN